MTLWTRLLLVACISVSATSCEWWRNTKNPAAPSDDPGPSAGVTDADLQFCVDETNRLRATIGRAPLARSSAIEAFALAAAQSDHVSGVPHAYFTSQAVVGAENEVLRQAIAQAARTAIERSLAGFWGEGPGGPHYENMARPFYTQMGCGVVGTRDGLWTVVQELR